MGPCAGRALDQLIGVGIGTLGSKTLNAITGRGTAEDERTGHAGFINVRHRGANYGNIRSRADVERFAGLDGYHERVGAAYRMLVELGEVMRRRNGGPGDAYYPVAE